MAKIDSPSQHFKCYHSNLYRVYKDKSKQHRLFWKWGKWVSYEILPKINIFLSLSNTKDNCICDSKVAFNPLITG